MPVGFRERLISAAQDQVIDRQEWQDLRAIGQQAIAQRSKEAWMAKQVLPYLDKFQQTTQIKYGIPGATLNFTFTPTYSESESIPGKTPAEQVAYISQSDTLAETQGDDHRCGAGALLNAWLLLGGSFMEAAQRVGLNTQERSLTYQNVHLAQESLYNHANTNGRDGLTSSINYTHRQGQIVSADLSQEVADAASKLGLNAIPLVGATRDSLNLRQSSVNQFFAQHPQGVLMAGVNLDPDTGDIHSVSEQYPMNHFVVIHREAGQFYLVDTGASDNGAGNSRHSLDEQQMQGMVYQTSGHVIGLTIKR